MLPLSSIHPEYVQPTCMHLVHVTRKHYHYSIQTLMQKMHLFLCISWKVIAVHWNKIFEVFNNIYNEANTSTLKINFKSVDTRICSFRQTLNVFVEWEPWGISLHDTDSLLMSQNCLLQRTSVFTEPNKASIDSTYKHHTEMNKTCNRCNHTHRVYMYAWVRIEINYC